MANWYVYSGAAGAATGADWANAYVTLEAAVEAAGTAAGDNIWIANDHAETQASALTITNKNTEALPGTIICVNRAGSVPPVAADLATTATVTTTGANAMTLSGVADGSTYWYGITFNAGTGATTVGFAFGTAAAAHVFQNCNFKKLGTTASGTAHDWSGKLRFDNCTVQFGATGDSIRLVSYRVEWLNTASAIAGATIPTTLFVTAATISGSDVLIHGVDLSAIAGTLIGNTTTAAFDFRLVNCKLNAAVTVSGVQANQSGTRVFLINCDSGAVNYRNEYHRHLGVQTTETTIVRTGGASDGTTPVSWKFVTTANAKWLLPFESLPMEIWCDSTGAKTIDVYGYWNNAAVPTNADIWIEATYLGDASFPISSTASSGKASYLAIAGNITEDTTSTWGGGDTTTRFKMTASLTAAMKGPISVVVKVGAASGTFYVDPKVVLT